ncbi:MAG: hypothetical protein ACTHQ3_06895 [Motilibacteraceae bacterium]
MSQTTFPFVPAQAPAPEQPQDEAPKKDNRLLFVLLGVLGLAVVGAAAWFFLLSGGSSEEPAGGPVALPKPKPAASASPSASSVATPAPKALDASVGVDPFKPLAQPSQAPSAGGTTGGTTTTGGSTTTGGTTTGGTTTPTNPFPFPTSAPAPVPAPSGGTTAQPEKPPFLVQLLKVTSDGKSAWIGVNGTPYLTKVGSVFDTYFKVTALDKSCATVQYGDVVGGKACLNQGLIIP